MTIDLRTELRRPAPAVLLAIAVIGWAVAIYFAWSSHAQRTEAAARQQQLQASNQQLSSELDRQRIDQRVDQRFDQRLGRPVRLDVGHARPVREVDQLRGGTRRQRLDLALRLRTGRPRSPAAARPAPGRSGS